MGKSPKPLSILLTDPEMETWVEIEELRKKGHTVNVDPSPSALEDFDIILGPTCWRMTSSLRKYFSVAIAAARKARYPKRGDEE